MGFVRGVEEGNLVVAPATALRPSAEWNSLRPGLMSGLARVGAGSARRPGRIEGTTRVQVNLVYQMNRMNDEGRHGKIWNDYELDVIVADYFVMLKAELSRTLYVKSRHSAALMERIGRSHRSVEFKHQNISAVLNKLGLPWISGYIPKDNYQNAIFGAIDRFLSEQSAFLQLVSFPKVEQKLWDVFVDPPSLVDPMNDCPELTRLVRKYDPVERDRRNRVLGRAGEEFVVEVERRQLLAAGRADLSEMVRWVSIEDGDGAGYDVRSYAPTGADRLIEVKTTNGSARTPFFLSRNECDLAMERPFDWQIYRVHLFVSEPKIFIIQSPLNKALRLRPETWRASF